MTGKYVATSTITINALPSRVWAVITDLESVGELFFGSEVITDWTVGSPIIWRGEWEGKPFEDRGEIIAFEPGRRLETTHFSPLTGQPDVAENYHTLTWTLEPSGTQTVLTLMQDNNDSVEAAAHSRSMWDTLLASAKDAAEGD
jgi:uncharacterized protein YndB with AHSA1/START domain